MTGGLPLPDDMSGLYTEDGGGLPPGALEALNGLRESANGLEGEWQTLPYRPGQSGGALPPPGAMPGGLSSETRTMLMDQIKRLSQPAKRQSSLWTDPAFLAGLTLLGGGNMGQAGMAAARAQMHADQTAELGDAKRANALASLTGRLAEADKASLLEAKAKREAISKALALVPPTQRGRLGKLITDTGTDPTDALALQALIEQNQIPMAPNFKAVAGVGLVDMAGEQPKVVVPVQHAPPAPPAAVAEYNFAKSQGYQGSFMDFQKAQKEKAGGGDPFAGTGMDAQVGNILNRLGPKIQNGTATEEEQRVYAYAYSKATEPKPITDAENGKVYFVPQEVPAHFPKPTMAPQPNPPAVPPQTPPAQSAAAAPGTPPGGVSPGVRSVDLPAKPKEMTEGQANAALYADRMRASEKVIAQMEAEGLNPLSRAASKVPGVGNYLVSPEYQQLDQAKRDFINATLRRESGAAIAASEFENADKQYFPVPGDSPEVLAQKKQNRRIALEGISRAAGKTYQPATSGGNAGKYASMPPSELAKVDVSTLSKEDLEAFIEATK